MNPTQPTADDPASSKPMPKPAPVTPSLSRSRAIKLALWGAALLVVFAKPLWDLFRLALAEDLHSHVLLIPLISGYLIHSQRRQLPWQAPASQGLAWATSFLGLAVAGAALIAGGRIEHSARLAALILSFVIMVQALGFAVLGKRWMKAATFPMLFLLFMVPLPNAMAEGLETALKLGSAETSDLFFQLSGIPFLRDGVIFQLPGITLEVAQECSGIRSSYVLFITSLLAGYLFLRSPWRRGILAFAVIPLGLLRNGFRIMVIGLLCVHYGPHMIDSIIHRRGGPLFFALSLIPLFVLLWWLRRREELGRKHGVTSEQCPGNDGVLADA